MKIIRIMKAYAVLTMLCEGCNGVILHTLYEGPMSLEDDDMAKILCEYCHESTNSLKAKEGCRDEDTR